MRLPVLYLLRNQKEDLPASKVEEVEKLFCDVREFLNDFCELFEGTLTKVDFLGLRDFPQHIWFPKTPCDGLVLLFHYRPSIPMLVQISQAVSPRDRKPRPVPVLAICNTDLNVSNGFFSNITLEMDTENLEFWTFPVSSPIKFVVKHFIERKFAS